MARVIGVRSVTIMDRNPAWTDRILNRNWDAIRSRVGGDQMPVIASSTRTGKRHFEELGCGHYGCVLETNKPSVVFKITSDVSEAAFVSAALDLPEWPTGVIRYYDIFELPETYRKRRVFVLLRQEAFNIGALVPQMPFQMMPEPHRGRYVKRYGKHSLREFFGYLRQFLHTAGQMRAQMKRTKDPVAFLEKAHAARDEAWHIYSNDRGFTDRNAHYNDKIRVVSWATGALAFELRRTLLEELAMTMQHTHAGSLIGEAFGYYIEQGMLLADVHYNNIGEAVPEGHDDWDLVITDPGHMVPLEPRWLNVKVQSL